MDDSLSDYFDALNRLLSNSPKIVPKGTRISNDAVSLEAGRKKGSIKKSRTQFGPLVVAIETARRQQHQAKAPELDKLEVLRTTVSQLRAELEAALGREFSLLIELREVREQLGRRDGSSVTEIRNKR